MWMCERLFTLLCLFVVITAQNPINYRLERSMEYFEEANILYNEGNFETALHFFRAALRLSPEYELFLVSTASLEMRMGFVESAGKRIDTLKRLGLHSPFSDDDNTFVLEKSICSNHLKYRNLSVREVSADRILKCGVACFDIDGFLDLSYVPFVVRNALNIMEWNTSSLTHSSLASIYGDHEADFYPQNLLEKPKKIYRNSIKDILKYIEYPDGAYLSVDASNPGAYGQWNINNSMWEVLMQDAAMSIPKSLAKGIVDLFRYELSYVRDEKGRVADGIGKTMHNNETILESLSLITDHFHQQTHWNMILIGEAGSGMFNHQDVLPVGSWQAQIEGAKIWTLCPPLQQQSENTAGAEDTNSGQKVDHLVKGEPSYSECPQSYPVECYTTEVSSGDLIYYPPHFWHTTMNTHSPSIAISSTVVLESHREELVSFLMNECSHSTAHKFQLSESFCEYVGSALQV